MKSTGIVRRIDDLGRIVIPKEIRRTLRIREGDPLEIYTDIEGNVIFRKYSPMADICNFAAEICKAVKNSTGACIAVTDKDRILAVGLRDKHLVDLLISEKFSNILHDRAPWETDGTVIFVDKNETETVSAIIPIIVQGEVMGAVAILGSAEAKHDAGTYVAVQTVATFLAQQLE